MCLYNQFLKRYMENLIVATFRNSEGGTLSFFFLYPPIVFGFLSFFFFNALKFKDTGALYEW